MIDNPYYLSIRTDIQPYIPQRIERTLDVGCATGVFSEMLKETRMVEAWGIEMVEECAHIAKTKLDNVLIGTFDEVYQQLPNDYFDCVFFNDVLEHMLRPEDALRKIKEKLASNGIIIASIPNIRFIGALTEVLVKKDWKYTDSGIFDRTHLRFYTKKSIIRLFDENGYKINTIEGINGVSKSSLTNIIDTLLLGAINDIKYRQFLIVATPK